MHRIALTSKNSRFDLEMLGRTPLHLARGSQVNIFKNDLGIESKFVCIHIYIYIYIHYTQFGIRKTHLRSTLRCQVWDSTCDLQRFGCSEDVVLWRSFCERLPVHPLEPSRSVAGLLLIFVASFQRRNQKQHKLPMRKWWNHSQPWYNWNKKREKAWHSWSPIFRGQMTEVAHSHMFAAHPTPPSKSLTVSNLELQGLRY